MTVDDEIDVESDPRPAVRPHVPRRQLARRFSLHEDVQTADASVEMVMAQTLCSREVATAALARTQGDLVDAFLLIDS